MRTSEIRRRLQRLRAEQAEVARAIAALERLEKLRLGRVVELVPVDAVMEAQRRRDAAVLLEQLAA